MAVTFSSRRVRICLATLTTMTSFYVIIVLYMVSYNFLQNENIMATYFVGRGGYQSHRRATQYRIQHNSNCTQKKNFVFIKGMKCATSTLLGVFYRFGYTRNLSFVSPLKQNLWLNWPYPMTLRDFRPSSRGYNILTDHSIYTENVMRSIMPEDTVYISIIREPFSQLKSLFQYFQIAAKAGVPKDVDNPVVEYFTHLKKYESAYKAPGNKERGCIPEGFSLTKNLMSHCHGMPLGFPPGAKDISNDTEAIQSYIKHLDSKFSLIMIREYFYESLILLRRLMCWTLKDILFINYNIAKYAFKTAPVPENILDLHKQWSNADYMLYNYFNTTFWKHVSNQGPEFVSELETFKNMERLVQDYCTKIYTYGKGHSYPVNMSKIVLDETKWNVQFSISSEDCWVLGPNPYDLLHVVQRDNDVKEAHLLAEQNKIPDNRTMKGGC
ncbi:unnamed protein product [Candidula unifasciata]|uniref:Galactose-3-O-sulfotransferase 2-like n=1 Tax=Candidula unifasciata TaxID=100452 RepID=A0A8S3ZWI6_9EUPU|nr:unnamed protein product [Candidula unifasciata]